MLPIRTHEATERAELLVDPLDVSHAFDSSTTPAGLRELSPEARRTIAAAFINLIRVEGLPDSEQGMSAEQKIMEAIQPLGGELVTIRRVVRGDVPDDTIGPFSGNGSSVSCFEQDANITEGLGLRGSNTLFGQKIGDILLGWAVNCE